MLHAFVARLDESGACRWLESPPEWGFCPVIANALPDGGAHPLILDEQKRASLARPDPSGRTGPRRPIAGSWHRPASMIVDAGKLIVTDREVVRADVRRRFVASCQL